MTPPDKKEERPAEDALPDSIGDYSDKPQRSRSRRQKRRKPVPKCVCASFGVESCEVCRGIRDRRVAYEMRGRR